MSAKEVQAIQNLLDQAEAALDDGKKSTAQTKLSQAFERGKPNNMTREQQRQFQQLNKQTR